MSHFLKQFRTARRRDLPGMIDLTQRRKWYDDQPPGAPGPDKQLPPDDGDGDDDTLPPDVPAWVQTRLKKANAEAARYRNELRTYQTETEKQNQKDLAEQGRWKDLYEQAKPTLESASQMKDRLALLEGAIVQRNEARVQAIPEDLRDMVPEYADPVQLEQWLDKNASRLTRSAAPNLDAGKRGDRGANITLTAAQLDAAKKAGLTPEQYAKYL